MWTLTVNIYMPLEDIYDYRLQIIAARDGNPVPAEYDTDKIFLWQKDDTKPESAPVTVDYFTNVCSIADLTLRPEDTGAAPTDILYRKNELDMVFRSRDLMEEGLSMIQTDIDQLKNALNDVITVTDDPDYNTSI